MSRFLGIDLGTTFLKGAVLDLDARRLAHIWREPFPEPVPGLPVGHCEIDPHAVLTATRRLLAALLADEPGATGLVVTSQMHCLVFTDDAGRPLSNVFTWKDQRALEPHPAGGTYLDWVRNHIPEAELIETGRELRAGLPVVNLAWLAAHGRVPAGAIPASLPDFVLANLCGTAPVAEPTHAASMGVFHLARNDWHRDVIARLGLPDLRWPRVVDTGAPVGTADLDGRQLRCFAPVGDQQCALLGADLSDSELSVNISTGSQVSVRTSAPLAGDFLVRPYPGGGWLSTVVQVPAGRSLAVLVNLLTELGGSDRDPWEVIAEATEAIADTSLRVDLGFFGGPFGGNGSISNIGEHNLTVGGLFLAAFRNMAENYAKCVARLAPAGGWNRVVFSGGLSHRFPALRAATLKALGDPTHRVCPHTEDTLAGLLALALVAE